MVLTAGLLALIFMWTGMADDSVYPPCDQHMFDTNVKYCLSDFNTSMETTGYQDRCPWPVKGIYYRLKSCVDDVASATLCRGVGFLVDHVYLGVHQVYFSQCGEVHDPPLTTLIMLIAPGIIATLSLPLLCVHLTTSNT